MTRRSLHVIAGVFVLLVLADGLQEHSPPMQPTSPLPFEAVDESNDDSAFVEAESEAPPIHEETIREKNARRLRDFYEGKISLETPPFANYQAIFYQYLAKRSLPVEPTGDPKPLVDLCWEGVGFACSLAGRNLSSKIAELEQRRSQISPTSPEALELAQQIPALESAEKNTAVLGCLQGIAESCLDHFSESVISRSPTLWNQMSAFCDQGNPSYCVAQGHASFQVNNGTWEEKEAKAGQLYARGCEGGDLLGCVKAIESPGMSSEQIETAQEALKPECFSPQASDQTAMISWQSSDACLALIRSSGKAGNSAEALRIAEFSCQKGDEASCYEGSAQMMKAGDFEAAYTFMKAFCQQAKSEDAYGTPPAPADCALIRQSTQLTPEVWSAMSRAPASLFSALSSDGTPPPALRSLQPSSEE